MQALQRALVALRTARACRVQPTPAASVRHYASGNGGGGVGPAAAGVQDEKETAAELGKKEGQGDTGAAASGNTSSPNGGAGAGQAGPDENEQQRQAFRSNDLAALGRGLSMISSVLMANSTNTVTRSTAYSAVKMAAKAARDAAVQQTSSSTSSPEAGGDASEAGGSRETDGACADGEDKDVHTRQHVEQSASNPQEGGAASTRTGNSSSSSPPPPRPPAPAPAPAPSSETAPAPESKTADPPSPPQPPPPRIEISSLAQARAVPSSRFGRVWEFGSLGVGLGMGALGELGRRAIGGSSNTGGSSGRSAFLTEENTERVVATLCRVRGAALKIGQMVSIQDSSFLPPEMIQIFDRVRDNADFMPTEQMLKQMEEQLGPDWRDVLLEFEEQPFAAASIGQVHRAVLPDGRHVAVKVQYPGVAESIDSDINNLLGLLQMTGLVPKGLYVERVLETAKKELRWECDYEREAACSERFASLVSDTPLLHVPGVIHEASSARVLTTELVQGMTLEKVEQCDQETRNQVAAEMMRVTLRELFEFRFMQTDPNWSNFLYDDTRNQLNLLDFGATIEYEKEFIDNYIEVIHAASTGDEEKCLKWSVRTGFLSGGERTIMQRAHVRAVMALGKPFATDEKFDFGEQDVIEEVKSIIPIMLKYREKSPPTETYSLHRKLSGAFLLCARLRANISCGPMFREIYEQYPRGEVQEEGGRLESVK